MDASMDTSMDISMDVSVDISMDISMHISMDASMDMSMDVSASAPGLQLARKVRYSTVPEYCGTIGPVRIPMITGNALDIDPNIYSSMRFMCFKRVYIYIYIYIYIHLSR